MLCWGHPPMGKLMRVTRGTAFLVGVDIRKGSPTLGAWFGLEVSAKDRKQVWAPAGFARGFCVLSDYAEIQYKCTGVYNSQGESGIRWDDPAIGAAEAIDASPYKGKIFVVGNDGGPDALSRICGNSSFDGTVYVAYEDWAKVLVQEFGHLFSGQAIDGRWLFTPQFIVSRLLHNCPPTGKTAPSAGYFYSYWTK